ncbi:hypothetical protein ACQJBY_028216 [Aegilops geniculata]
MVFHPDGKTLFCGLEQSLKVFSWEPVRCHDAVDMRWNNLADLSIYEGKLLGCSYHERRVGVWVADISLIEPYALGVLPKANFFAELVDSVDDNPVKPNGSTAKPIRAVATSHPKNMYKVQESGIAESRVRALHLTPGSTDKIKKDRSSSIPRRPDSSVKPSTPVRRMKPIDSPSTNLKTAERSFGQRDIQLLSRTGMAINSSTTKKAPPTESVAVKDIYTTSQAVSVPVVVPRDILEDKSAGSIHRGIGGRTAVPDDFYSPVHLRKRLPSGDSVSSVKSMLAEPDVCSEGFSGLKFSFGLTPNDKKEESDRTDKGEIRQIAEKMDRIVSFDHPVQSNDDKGISLSLFLSIQVLRFCSFWEFNIIALFTAAYESPCSTTGTARVKYVRGVAVPLGKTKSLVERFEKRESSSIDCSSPTGSCGDHTVKADSPPTSLAEASHTYERDLPTVDEMTSPIDLVRNHDEFINVVKSRLTKLEMMRHVFNLNGIKGAIAAVAKLPDIAVQADVVSTLKGKLGLFNLDIFSSLLPVLAGLLNSKTERHAIVALEMLLDLIKIFGPVIHSTLSSSSPVGVDLQAEQRRSGQSAQLAQELNMSLQDLVVF